MGWPAVSAIVLNHNGAHVLSDCLDSLAAQDVPLFEILVVDNASADGSREVVRRYPAARWVGLESNEGLGPGYNAGAAQARGEFLFFLNNDTALEPSCARQLLGAIRPDVLAADPLQLDWDGRRVIHGAQRFRWRWRCLARPLPFFELFQDSTAAVETEVPWGCAGALLMDRKKFESLGGFDPSFFLDFEDTDICWRGWLKGWRTVFVPSARLRHRVGESGVTLRRQLSQYQNAQRFVLKVMPWPVALAAALAWGFGILSDLARGRLRAARLRLQASWRNFAALPVILKDRQRSLSNRRSGSAEILRRWNRAGARGDTP